MTIFGLFMGYLLIGAIVMRARTQQIALEADLTGQSVVAVAAWWVATWPLRL